MLDVSYAQRLEWFNAAEALYSKPYYDAFAIMKDRPPDHVVAEYRRKLHDQQRGPTWVSKNVFVVDDPFRLIFRVEEAHYHMLFGYDDLTLRGLMRRDDGSLLELKCTIMSDKVLLVDAPLETYVSTFEVSPVELLQNRLVDDMTAFYMRKGMMEFDAYRKAYKLVHKGKDPYAPIDDEPTGTDDR